MDCRHCETCTCISNPHLLFNPGCMHAPTSTSWSILHMSTSGNMFTTAFMTCRTSNETHTPSFHVMQRDGHISFLRSSCTHKHTLFHLRHHAKNMQATHLVHHHANIMQALILFHGPVTRPRLRLYTCCPARTLGTHIFKPLMDKATKLAND